MGWKEILKDDGYGQLNDTYVNDAEDWTDAFSKFGFGDDLDSSDKTDIVVEFIESRTPNTRVMTTPERVKYVVETMRTTSHNDFIYMISYSEEDYRTEKGTKAVYSYRRPESAEEQIKRNDPELFNSLESKFKGGV